MKKKYFITILLMHFFYISKGENIICKCLDCNIQKKEYSYQFTYNPTKGIRLDTFRYTPPGFTIELPLSLKYCENDSFSYFRFIFDKNQAVFITFDLFRENSLRDTIYSPPIDEIKHIVDYPYWSEDFSKEYRKIVKIANNYTRKNYQTRENTLIVKDNVKILFFNLKKENYEKFISIMNSFIVY